MLKKVLLMTMCLLVISSNIALGITREPQPQLKPLKIEEKTYKYGNIEKTLRNPAASDYDSYADDNSRKTTSVLDIINTVMLILLTLIAIILLSTKIRGLSLIEILKNKKQNNKFSILSAKQLGNGKTVYLLELNGRQIIVGTTESKVDSIMPLDKSYSTDEIPSEYIEKLFNDTSNEFKNLEE